jgi:hypothetical protein
LFLPEKREFFPPANITPVNLFFIILYNREIMTQNQDHFQKLHYICYNKMLY